ncbi:MAG: rhodanese-like domain-containing protein [Lachnospiraceae bacterium]|nr:rhodanese-like domain-containing protein [Lachnospiraceae bacterium]
MKYLRRRISRTLSILMGVCLMFSLFGCGKTVQVMDGDGMVYEPSYAHISQDEARLMMQDGDGHVIVDVRRADEYAIGHIPGAILIPNESIKDTPPEELPDKNQIILVYCRTGRRSKEASQKLADMGYVNVYEFGGIEDWTGDIVTEEIDDNPVGEKASLSFESFDGGGPDFNVVIVDEGIVSYETEVKYHNSDHGEMTGSGFDKIITFTGIKPGETMLVVEERSPIADNLDHTYRITVDDELNVQIEQLSVKDINE